MKLKFIGTDGSMGLHNGQIYEVSILSSTPYIIVQIHRGAWTYGCPYDSLKKLNENWVDP
jgi:hypothetical protein